MFYLAKKWSLLSAITKCLNSKHIRGTSTVSYPVIDSGRSVKGWWGGGGVCCLAPGVFPIKWWKKGSTRAFMASPFGRHFCSSDFFTSFHSFWQRIDNEVHCQNRMLLQHLTLPRLGATRGSLIKSLILDIY